jgi:co-chaperonin GroES (HSP10)
MIQPLQDRVLIKLDGYVQTGTIIIPEKYKEDERTGTVLAVGPGKHREDERGKFFEPTQVKQGDRVMVSPAVNIHYDDIIKKNGEVMVQEADILGIYVP